MKKKLTTNELLEILKSTRNEAELHNYTQSHASSLASESYPEYFLSNMEQQNMTSAELIRRSEIQRNYGYQILNGDKRPGRDKIISLCLALSLSIDDTQKALTLAGEGILYPKKQRDSILIFCINNQLSVSDANKILFDMGEPVLT